MEINWEGFKKICYDIKENINDKQILEESSTKLMKIICDYKNTFFLPFIPTPITNIIKTFNEYVFYNLSFEINDFIDTMNDWINWVEEGFDEYEKLNKKFKFSFRKQKVK